MQYNQQQQYQGSPQGYMPQNQNMSMQSGGYDMTQQVMYQPQGQMQQPQMMMVPMQQQSPVVVEQQKPKEKQSMFSKVTNFVSGGSTELPNYIHKKREPARFKCLKCNYEGKSRIDYKLGTQAYMFMCLFSFTFPPLICLPCCIKTMKDVYHYCPSCDAECGKAIAGHK